MTGAKMTSPKTRYGKIRYDELISSLFVWRSWATDGRMFMPVIRPCLRCKKLTTGVVKNVRSGRTATLCEECARRKGLA